MHMKATISGNQLASKVALPDDVWKALGRALVTEIQARTTRRNVDADYAAFVPYSDGYADLKRRAGRGAQVDLIGIGAKLKGRKGVPSKNRMMSDIAFATNAVSNPRLTIYFATAEKEELAQYHNLTGAGKSRVKRQFFALSDKDIEDSVAFVRRRLQQRG